MFNNVNKDSIKSANSTKSGDFILEPSEILGATDDSGELMFLIRWKDTNRADMVSARVANLKWPQMVIKYYEDRVIFHAAR